MNQLDKELWSKIRKQLWGYLDIPLSDLAHDQMSIILRDQFVDRFKSELDDKLHNLNRNISTSSRKISTVARPVNFADFAPSERKRQDILGRTDKR